MTDQPFRPMSPTATIGVTNSTATTTMPGDSKSHPQVSISSQAGGATAFMEFGNNAISATTTSSMPILAGTTRIISISPNHTHVAMICSATATVYVTQGQGSL